MSLSIFRGVVQKDSGIFYLGKVNHNWRLTKIGYVCTKLTRSFEPSDTALICSNKGKVLIRDANMTGIMVSEDNAMQGIKRGDIAIHGMDTWHGAIALSDYDGKITRVVHVCDSTEDKRFIVYWLQYLAFQGVYKLISNGVRGNTSDFRSWDKVSDISIALPQTKEEQHKICDYLDNICLEAESIINQKKEQIDILESYKKSLIYEYVTGKKEVPAAESDVIAVVLDPHIIMLGLAIDKLGKDIKGKTQLQKILYLLDEYLGFTHSTQYYRYAHGPYDLQLNNYIDALTNNHWYEHQRHGADILVKGTNHNNFVAEHGNVFAEKNAEVDKLINFLKPMKTSQVERIATLFAAWNDFIIDGNANPTDDQIINEVMTNWTPNKGHTQYTTWQSTLAKMKQHSIIPKGKGLHTLPMPKKENTDE